MRSARHSSGHDPTHAQHRGEDADGYRTIGDEFDDICRGMDVMMNDFRQRFLSAWQMPRWLPTPANRRRDRATAVLDGVIQGIIAQRRATAHDHGDLLSTLMKARDADDGSRMSDKQLRDEVMTLLLAGHETTANLLPGRVLAGATSRSGSDIARGT